jgi:hypothetical protein
MLTRKKCAEGILIAGFFLLPVSFLILVAQFIWYLKDGVWPYWVLAILVILGGPSPFLRWIEFPQDWHGLHTIVMWILFAVPLWVDVLALAGICMFVGTKMDED